MEKAHRLLRDQSELLAIILDIEAGYGLLIQLMGEHALSKHLLNLRSRCHSRISAPKAASRTARSAGCCEHGR
jgi:hypothetical protein